MTDPLSQNPFNSLTDAAGNHPTAAASPPPSPIAINNLPAPTPTPVPAPAPAAVPAAHPLTPVTAEIYAFEVTDIAKDMAEIQVMLEGLKLGVGDQCSFVVRRAG